MNVIVVENDIRHVVKGVMDILYSKDGSGFLELLKPGLDSNHFFIMENVSKLIITNKKG